MAEDKKNKKQTQNKKTTENKKQNENLTKEKDKKQTQQTQNDNEVQKLKQEIEELKKQLNELNDKYLRLAAEYDNYRKRTLKEKTELVKTAGENIFISLLPVIDNFERALESLEQTTDIEAVKEGIFHIYKGFKDFLEKHNVKEIEALNQPLDTDLHEAVAQAPAPSEDLKGKIIDVIQKGYKLNNKVIRHSKVVVGQ